MICRAGGDVAQPAGGDEAQPAGGDVAPRAAGDAAPALAGGVVLLGDVNIDQVLTVPDIPEPGGDSVASSQHTYLGGSATNTAVALARLGIPARIVARVGTDANATVARAALVGEGVDVAHLSIDVVEPTAVNTVLVTPDGQRTMYAYRGANAALAPTHLRHDMFDGAAILHLSGYSLIGSPQRDAALEAIRRAGELGLAVTLDVPVAGAQRAATQTLALLPVLAAIVVGEAELVALTGHTRIPDAVRDLASGTGVRVAVKHGSAGASLYSGTGHVDLPALPVNAVDTTGAGDAFAAGLIVGMLAGLDDLASLALANALGAMATTRPGAGTALPAAEGLARVLRHGWGGDARHREAAGRAADALLRPIPGGHGR